MSSIFIDSCTQWQSLPWVKISEKLFIIQKRIYQYSKDYNKNNIYKLQNYIMNSSDVKILAIQISLNDINQYYINYNQEKYLFNDFDKLLIYKSLLNNYLYNSKFHLIIEKVKQYIIYLCIKPEWEARFEPIYKSNINQLSECYFIERLSKFISYKMNFNFINKYITSFKYKILNKYIDIIYLNNKMQALYGVKNHLNFWLKNQNFTENLDNHSSTDLDKIYIYTHLYKFLQKIILNGIYWFNIVSIQNYKVVKFLVLDDTYLLFDNNNDYWIYTHHQILKNIFIDNIIIFYQAIGFNTNLYKFEHCLNTFNVNSRQNIISDYLIKYYHQNIILGIVQVKQSIYQHFLKQIRYILYHKDYLSRWRTNNIHNMNYYFMQLDIKFIYFYKFYFPVINLFNIQYLFSSIDHWNVHI